MLDQSLGTVTWVYRRHSLTYRRRRQHDALALVRPADGTAGATSRSRPRQGTSDRKSQRRFMCVDVEPGMRTAAAVAWEAAAKISLLVLASSLLDRECCSSVTRCIVAAPADAAARAAAVAAAAYE